MQASWYCRPNTEHLGYTCRPQDMRPTPMTFLTQLPSPRLPSAVSFPIAIWYLNYIIKSQILLEEFFGWLRSDDLAQNSVDFLRHLVTVKTLDTPNNLLNSTVRENSEFDRFDVAIAVSENVHSANKCRRLSWSKRSCWDGQEGYKKEWRTHYCAQWMDQGRCATITRRRDGLKFECNISTGIVMYSWVLSTTSFTWYKYLYWRVVCK